MRNVTEHFLIYIIGIIIAIAFVSMVYMFGNSGRGLLMDSGKKTADFTNVLNEDKYMQYIGVNLSGAQVIAAITDMYDASIPVRVQISSSDYKEFNVNGITKAEEIMIAKRNIKDSAFYKGSLKTDSATGNIVGVEFLFAS